jgi:hypothetical protein
MDSKDLTESGSTTRNKEHLSLPVVRSEFGFRRTSCDCELCSCWCRIMPGFLVPSDLQRLCPAGVDLMTWAKEHLRASRGFVVFNPTTGEKVQIPSLVPAKQANGHCHWLLPDGHCAVHADAPFGCAFVDQHMNDDQALERNMPARLARQEDFANNGPYSQVWHMLMQEGLVGGGEYAAAKVEMLKVKAKIAKRAEWQARKERRKKRKKARR